MLITVNVGWGDLTDESVNFNVRLNIDDKEWCEVIEYSFLVYLDTSVKNNAKDFESALFPIVDEALLDSIYKYKQSGVTASIEFYQAIEKVRKLLEIYIRNILLHVKELDEESKEWCKQLFFRSSEKILLFEQLCGVVYVSKETKIAQQQAIKNDQKANKPPLSGGFHLFGHKTTSPRIEEPGSRGKTFNSTANSPSINTPVSTPVNGTNNTTATDAAENPTKPQQRKSVYTKVTHKLFKHRDSSAANGNSNGARHNSVGNLSEANLHPDSVNNNTNATTTTSSSRPLLLHLPSNNTHTSTKNNTATSPKFVDENSPMSLTDYEGKFSPLRKHSDETASPINLGSVQGGTSVMGSNSIKGDEGGKKHKGKRFSVAGFLTRGRKQSTTSDDEGDSFKQPTSTIQVDVQRGEELRAGALHYDITLKIKSKLSPQPVVHTATQRYTAFKDLYDKLIQISIAGKRQYQYTQAQIHAKSMENISNSSTISAISGNSYGDNRSSFYSNGNSSSENLVAQQNTARHNSISFTSNNNYNNNSNNNAPNSTMQTDARRNTITTPNYNAYAGNNSNTSNNTNTGNNSNNSNNSITRNANRGSIGSAGSKDSGNNSHGGSNGHNYQDAAYSVSTAEVNHSSNIYFLELLTAPFPTTAQQSFFSFGLSDTELSERTRGLDAWFRDVCTHYRHMPALAKAAVRAFLNFDMSQNKDIYVQDQLIWGSIDQPDATASVLVVQKSALETMPEGFLEQLSDDGRSAGTASQMAAVRRQSLAAAGARSPTKSHSNDTHSVAASEQLKDSIWETVSHVNGKR